MTGSIQHRKAQTYLLGLCNDGGGGEFWSDGVSNNGDGDDHDEDPPLLFLCADFDMYRGEYCDSQFSPLELMMMMRKPPFFSGSISVYVGESCIWPNPSYSTRADDIEDPPPPPFLPTWGNRMFYQSHSPPLPSNGADDDEEEASFPLKAHFYLCGGILCLTNPLPPPLPLRWW